MKSTLLVALLSAGALAILPLEAQEATESEPKPDKLVSAPSNVAEARARSHLLHETIHGTLQVVHRDFFDDDDPHTIPSASLEDVFEELAETHGVRLKWLIVDTDVVNVDHQAKDDFERAAVKELKAGKQHHEAVEGERYRFAGPIRLASQCLKCHVQDRTSTDDRTAGLLISMPIQPTP